MRRRRVRAGGGERVVCRLGRVQGRARERARRRDRHLLRHGALSQNCECELRYCALTAVGTLNAQPGGAIAVLVV